MASSNKIRRSASDNSLNNVRTGILKRARGYFQTLFRNINLNVILSDNDWEYFLLIYLDPDFTEENISSVKKEILKHGHFTLSSTPTGEIKVKILEDNINTFKNSFRTTPEHITFNLPLSKKEESSSMLEKTPSIEKEVGTAQTQNTKIPQSKTQKIKPEIMTNKKQAELIELKKKVMVSLHGKFSSTKEYASVVCSKKEPFVVVNTRTKDANEKIAEYLKGIFLSVSMSGKQSIRVGLEEKTDSKANHPAAPKKTAKKKRAYKKRAEKPKKEKKAPAISLSIDEHLSSIKDSFETLKGQSSKNGEQIFNQFIKEYGKNAEFLVRTKTGHEINFIVIKKSLFIKLCS